MKLRDSAVSYVSNIGFGTGKGQDKGNIFYILKSPNSVELASFKVQLLILLGFPY